MLQDLKKLKVSRKLKKLTEDGNDPKHDQSELHRNLNLTALTKLYSVGRSCTFLLRKRHGPLSKSFLF